MMFLAGGEDRLVCERVFVEVSLDDVVDTETFDSGKCGASVGEIFNGFVLWFFGAGDGDDLVVGVFMNGVNKIASDRRRTDKKDAFGAATAAMEESV